MSGEVSGEDQEASDKAALTLLERLKRSFDRLDPRESEKAQIPVEGADDLYREIRVENKLQDVTGNEVSLKPGAHVEVTIEASSDEIVEKPPNQRSERKLSNPRQWTLESVFCQDGQRRFLPNGSPQADSTLRK